MPFEVGDRVSAFGCEGMVVHAEEEEKVSFPLHVDFDTGHSVSFTADGRLFLWTKTPSLTLISKAKPKYVEKTAYCRVMWNSEGAYNETDSQVFSSIEELFAYAGYFKTVGYIEVKVWVKE